MTYGQRIRKGREQAGLTQEALAEAVGVSRQAVSKWEADRSRPAPDKLACISEELDIPMETWAAIDAAEAEARRPPSARPWKIATAALSAALCVVLLLGAVLWPRPAEVSAEAETDGAEAETRPADISYMFPERLELTAKAVEDFGNIPLPAGDPAAVEEDSAEVLFIDQFPHSSWLKIVRTNPVRENNTTFYDVYALWYGAATGSALVSLGRLADYNHYVGRGLTGAEYVENVLGHDCWKITLTLGAAAVRSWYFTVNPADGAVDLLLEAGSPCLVQEADVDGDGEREVVAWGGALVAYTIYDARPDGRCIAYTLDQDSYGTVPISFSPENGFAVTDSAGDVMARYLLEENCLKRQPQTGFSLADYADAAGTEVHFLTAAADPDTVLDNGAVRFTLRQQAYLALQALYDLTGLKLDEAWCGANRDRVSFYTADGGDLFYDVTLGRQYGGSGFLTGFSIVWSEEENGSPLSFSAARRPQYYNEPIPERWLLKTCREDLDFFCDAEVVTAVPDPAERDGESRYVAYREDGGYYSACLLETDLGYALKSFYGPYPALETLTE